MDSVLSGAPSNDAGDASGAGNDAGSANNPKMRKRTKTGCLTCRKRRIKCGEERPTCANCIKSKRQCEGYNQRVIFKPPIGDWPNHPGVVSTLQFHSSMLPGTRTGYRGNQPTTIPQDGAISSAAAAAPPRTLAQYDFSNISTGPMPGQDMVNNQPVLVGGGHTYNQDTNYQQPLHSPHHQQPLHSPHHQLPTPTSATSYFPTQPSPVHASFPGSFAHDGNAAYDAQQRYAQGTHFQQASSPYDAHFSQKSPVSQSTHDQGVYQHMQRSGGASEEQSSYPLHSYPPLQVESYPQPADQTHRFNSNSQIEGQSLPSPRGDFSQGGSYAHLHSTTHTASTHSTFQPVQIPSHTFASDVKYVPQHAHVLEQPTVSEAKQPSQPQLLLSGFGGDDHVSPTQILDEAAVEYEDDDYYDVESDEEMLDEPAEKDEDAIILGQDFSLIKRLHHENTNDLDVRRYDAFIYEGILSHYKAENVANPLKNLKTARVFAHFIHVTGPSLSIFERNPRNPASILEGPIPPSHQSLWTYTLPLKALNNQGLLHAMLALASLHIAKLQRASVTPSYKHYAYALKRLGRSLGNPQKRLQIPTLATSLLLAFYEVMTAEHVKWSTHLVGAAQLLAELDFRSLTQEARRLKAVRYAEEQRFPYQNPEMLIDQQKFEQQLKESAMMPDAGLVSTIVGKKIDYDDFGRVYEEGNNRHERRQNMPGKIDLRSYETLQDLYWFYARNDIFQSIVSGNPLIMDFRKWSDCPPRAPLGRTDNLFGSHDHIVLLIARISDFIVRDRGRKIRQVEADGGQWRPRPGMPGMGGRGPPPSNGRGQHGQPPTQPSPMGPPPHMQGMGPPPGWKGGPPQASATGPPPTSLPPQGAGQQPMPPPNAQAPSTPAGPGFYGMAPSRGPAPLPTSYENPDSTHHAHSPGSPNSAHPQFADLPAAYEAALSDWNSISHAHATIASLLSNTPSFAPLTPDLYPPPPIPNVASNSNMTPFGPPLIHRSYDISILWCMLHLSQILLLRSHPSMPPAMMVAAGISAPAAQPYAILIGRITASLPLPSSRSTASTSSSSAAGAAEDAPLTPSLGAALIESTMSLFFAGIQYHDPGQREWLVTRLMEIDRRTGWASAGVIARGCETYWEKSAEAGRGPPYSRRMRVIHEEVPVDVDGNGTSSSSSGWGGERIIHTTSRNPPRNPWQVHKEKDRIDFDEQSERRFVVRYRTGYVPWAMNLLATEEDLRVGIEKIGIRGEINAAGTERERERVKGRQPQQ